MSGPVRVATAVTGSWEPSLVASLGGQQLVEVVRRCADLAELLAAAAAGQAQVAVLSADLPQLDGEALDRLRLGGCAVVAVADPADPGAGVRLARLGIEQVLASDSPGSAVIEAVLAASAGPEPARTPTGLGRLRQLGTAEPRSALPPVRPARSGVAASGTSGARLGAADEPSSAPGRVVAVWGPAGAPGRTTIATGIAAELAAGGAATLLVDADTHAASVAQVLGLLDEAAGLVSACRAADRGALDLPQLAGLTPLVADRWRVLTGLPRASRWPEVRASSLAAVLDTARSLAAWTVVDVGASLEQDEELAYDTAAPRRNAATLTAVTQADVVLAVGAAGPVGLQRLVRGLQDLAEVTGTRPVVVVNRVRASAVGARPGSRIALALERYAGVDDAVLVADDPAALDAALLAGRTLAEHARASPVRQGLLDIVSRLAVVAL